MSAPIFACVDHAVPEITVRLLREAAATRHLDFRHYDAARDTEPDEPLPPGSLLYRPGITMSAIRLEQALFGPGVATFYRDPGGPLFGYLNHYRLFKGAGIPIPRTMPVSTADPAALETAVAALGGYPVVVKLLGHSRGIGTIRADSLPALKSLLDWLLATNHAPVLAAYVDDATHWRITVIGERGLGCYRNVTDPGDFRTSATLDPAHYSAEAPPALGTLAVRATQALRLEFAGVDILEHPSGRLYVLEANFPCYFGQAQEAIGVDIAGAMLDHLMAKAARPQTEEIAAG